MKCIDSISSRRKAAGLPEFQEETVDIKLILADAIRAAAQKPLRKGS